MWNGGKCGTSCTGDNVRGVNSRTLGAVRHDFLWGEIAMRLHDRRGCVIFFLIFSARRCLFAALIFGRKSFADLQFPDFSIFYYHAKESNLTLFKLKIGRRSKVDVYAIVV